MAAGEHPLVEHSTVALVSDAADASSTPYVRPALFLRPRAGDGDGAAPPAAAAAPGDPGPAPVPARPRGIEAEFRGWARVPRRWPEWVDKLRGRHEPLWREAGILGGILASKCRVRRRRQHGRALLQLAAFWSGATATFVFPWGEATLTLADVAALAGLPLLGVPVRAPVSDTLEKDVAAIEAVRAVLNRSKKKKAGYGAWVKRFLDRAPDAEAEAPSSAADGDDGEESELLEHGAFLSMWLSLFVLPGPPFDVVRREVLPLAARLARGESVALAPAALAAIYHDLSALKRHITSGKNDEPLIVSAPMHILQLWVWEHFTQLSPEPVGSSALSDRDMPRAARWHEAGKKLSSKDVHEVFMSPKEFKWRPYGFDFGDYTFNRLHQETGCHWVTGQDIATSEVLLSFARCLHTCELVGISCIQQYNPHRVARQLGFDQDIPGTVPRASSHWEEAWETYNIEAKHSAFILPNHNSAVTVQYAKWWEPYSSRSTCGSAVANAAKTKEGHDFVSPVKRKMEGVLAGNSGKKLRVATATRGHPPNIPAAPAGINVYQSQSSGSHAARRRAATAPGRVLRACPPHLRFRAMSATGMPQPLPHAVYDPLDHISLSKRLNSITKMPKQHNTECLVMGSEQERIIEHVKTVIPKPPSVDPKKAVLHKVIGQALPDTVVSSAIDSSCGFGTERPQAKCLQQSKDQDPNSANGKNNSRTEHYDVVLLNVVQGAASTRSKATGAGTEVDMLPTHEDLLVISDNDSCDKSSSKGHEVHLKSHMSEAKMSHIREQNEDTKLVDARNDEVHSQVLKKVTKQGNFGDVIEISDDELDEETSKEGGVFVEATSKEVSTRSEAIGAGTEVDMLPTHEDLLVISDDNSCDKSSSKGHEVHLKYHMSGAKMSLIRERNEDTKLVNARNDEVHSQDLKEVTKQGHFGNIVEISDDELDEETSKESGVFVEATSKEDAPSTMHLKSPEMEPARTILQECNEEKQMVRETNDEQDDNLVMTEGMVQNSYDRQLCVLDDTTLRQQPDVLTQAATVQTYDGLSKGPTEEMDTCIVTGDIDNTDKVPNENFDSRNFSKKGNGDIFMSNQELEYPMEHSAGAIRKKSGYSDRISSRPLDGNTELVSHEVCSKTLYYLSRFDRMKDAWDKVANKLPRRAVGTMEMIQKASAIRQAEMAELKKEINTLKEEIRALEAAEKGKSPE